MLNLSKLWHSKPIYAAILEVIQKKRRSLIDTELYDELRGIYKDLSFKMFNKALMKLEIQGIIHTYNLTKNKRGVELAKSLDIF